jgi:hypothetical protein
VANVIYQRIDNVIKSNRQAREKNTYVKQSEGNYMIQPPKIEWVIACQKVNMAIIVYGGQVPHHKRRSFTATTMSQISPGRLSKKKKNKKREKRKSTSAQHQDF